jgi:predicted secreted protein
MRRSDIAAAIRFEVRVEVREHMATRTAAPASDATRWVVAAEKFNMAFGGKS